MGNNTGTAGLIYGPDFHHLDHLAPLCSLLSIPLLVTEEKMQKRALELYPDLQCVYYPLLELPEKLVLKFETIFYCLPRILFDQFFFLSQALHKKKIKTIWCPHGNSDKGRTSFFMEALCQEELLLVYGKRMKAFLREKGVRGKTLTLGNYRLKYYEKHKLFYEEKIKKVIKEGPKKRLLYAPTWQDGEKNSSFLTLCPILLEKLPKQYTLMIKLHPHLYLQYAEEIEKLKQKYKKSIFVKEFTPIYPLLAKTDVYIGDMSSIGYDCLAFSCPMLFLNEKGFLPSDPSAYLSQAGALLEKESYFEIYTHVEQLLREKDPLKDKKKKELYRETFGRSGIETLKKIIRK